MAVFVSNASSRARKNKPHCATLWTICVCVHVSLLFEYGLCQRLALITESITNVNSVIVNCIAFTAWNQCVCVCVCERERELMRQFFAVKWPRPPYMHHLRLRYPYWPASLVYTWSRIQADIELNASLTTNKRPPPSRGTSSVRHELCVISVYVCTSTLFIIINYFLLDN